MLPLRPRALTALAASSLLFTAACSSADDDGTTATDSTSGSANEDTVNIVTSTSIWGDVAKAVTDDESVAEISSIVEGNDDDPHHFDPSAADLARANEADIVVVGGGGYDSWLYDAIDNDDSIVHALPLTSHDHDHGDHEDDEHDHGDHAHDEHDHEDHEGHDHEGHDHGDSHDHGDFDPAGNEHIWYDTTAVATIAKEIDERIHELNPEAETNIDDLTSSLDELDKRIHDLPAVHVAQTEPIADYIIAHTDMHEITPASYRHATLNHSEAAASDLASFLDIINHGELDVLIYNEQTETDLTKRIRQAAEDNDVPVVSIGETPPDNTDFLEFFNSVIDNLESAAA